MENFIKEKEMKQKMQEVFNKIGQNDDEIINLKPDELGLPSDTNEEYRIFMAIGGEEGRNVGICETVVKSGIVDTQIFHISA